MSLACTKTPRSRGAISTRKFGQFALPWLLAGLVSGCVSLTPPPPDSATQALAHPETTRLGRTLAASERSHPGKSGFHILDYGLESLVARATIADSAERTLDAQYYIYDSDEAGSILAEHLLAAADRGVRVRLLLDDYNLGADRELAALCAHPNIQVRVFNPIACRARWVRFPAYALQLRKAGRRMHNKLFIADNEVAILGGRNVGNDYFNIRTNSAFRDFDILIAGPVCRQASTAFDEYWNSPWSVPATELVHRPPTHADLVAERALIHSRIKNAQEFETKYATTHVRYLDDLEHDGKSLIWAAGEIISEPPKKIDDDTSKTALVSQRLQEEWQRAQKEVLIEAAYFVPEESGVETFKKLHDRNVTVRLLTSSLDATDVPMVYSAYRKYRRDLLEAGVDLHEYHLHTPQNRLDQKWYHLRPSYGALHSKVIVFDRRYAWIGSFNLDPRSARLNTEIAVLVDSPELAGQLADAIAADLSPDRSWDVKLLPRAGGGSPEIAWQGEEDGKPVELRHDPASLGLRIESFFLSILPVRESQL